VSLVVPYTAHAFFPERLYNRCQVLRRTSCSLFLCRVHCWIESDQIHDSQSYFTTHSESVSQYVLVSSILVGLATRYYFLSECCCLKFAVLFLWGALSDERTGLQFAVYSLNGPSRPEPVTIFYCLIWDSKIWLRSHLRPPKPGGPGSRIYIPQEQGGPVIPPDTGFPLRCLLRLAGLQWRYSNPPPTWRDRSLCM
jgi:hypothetical protein